MRSCIFPAEGVHVTLWPSSISKSPWGGLALRHKRSFVGPVPLSSPCPSSCLECAVTWNVRWPFCDDESERHKLTMTKMTKQRDRSSLGPQWLCGSALMPLGTLPFISSVPETNTPETLHAAFLYCVRTDFLI